MARNGSGVYSLYTPGNPVVAGTTIDPVAFNNTTTDLATAMTNSVARNGEGVPTANWPMAGYKLTGLANGTTAGDSLAYGQPISVSTITTTGLLTASAALSVTGGATIAGGAVVTGGTTTDTYAAASQPSFQASRSTSNQSLTTGSNTLVFQNTYFDNASNYNTSTGVFTVPTGQGGRYLVAANMLLTNTGGTADSITVTVTGASAQPHPLTYSVAAGASVQVNTSDIYNLAATATVSIVTSGNTNTWNLIFNQGGGSLRSATFSMAKLN